MYQRTLKFKQIVVDIESYRTLKEMGKAGDSFNDVVKDLIKMRSAGCNQQN